MFVYLSKKIAIPNNHKVKCVAWSKEHGFIACGGESGLLKVIKLDSGGIAIGDEGGSGTGGGGSQVVRPFVAPKNLSMNQTLDGHTATVNCLAWNDLHQKLTSSDSAGLIVVWMMYKGSWYEEMVNNRNQSVITGMAWSSDGQKIAIVYEDGSIIVGNVDGNRIWGKELKPLRLSAVDWSPDGKLLVVGVEDMEVHVFDEKGVFMSKLNLPAIQGVYGRSSTSGDMAKLAGVDWHHECKLEHNGLAIAFDNGRVQLMRNESDEQPLILNTNLTLTAIKWNFAGNILAVAGRNEVKTTTSSDKGSEVKERNVVKFYNRQGDLVQQLKLPGKEITCCSWEREGLRVAIGLDCYVYFANIRPDYNWAMFGDTLVYALATSPLPNEFEGPIVEASTSIVFWNTISSQKNVKIVKNFVAIAGHGHYCVLVTRVDELTALSTPGVMSLVLCNAIGTPVDTIAIDSIVSKVALNSSQVVAASRDSFLVWTFETPVSKSSSSSIASYSKQDIAAFKYDIDDTDESGIKSGTGLSERRPSNVIYSKERVTTIFVSKTDHISCITMSEKVLVVGLNSGMFEVYMLPKVTSPIQSFSLACSPLKLGLNCDSSKLFIVETTSTALIYDLEGTTDAKSTPGRLLKFEKRDVWDMMWSVDNVDSFALIEKNKLMVYSDLEVEEAGYATGYLGQFKDLVVKTVHLDNLVNEVPNDDLKLSSYISERETKVLKDARKVLEKVGLSEASNFIEEMSHPRLWRLLAEQALRALDFVTAELALVRCKDFKGIQFAKRVAKLTSDQLKSAEVHAYFGEFDKAEKVYLDADRRDLAIKLRKVLGDYIRVGQLVKSDLGLVSDSDLKLIELEIGDHYAERLDWEEAIVHYKESNDLEKMFEAYCALDDFDGLKQLTEQFEPSRKMMAQFGQVFESVGMCNKAVDSYVRANQVDEAISCCVTLNEWKVAIELAHQHDVPHIDTILSQYAQHLLAKRKYFDIVELYRKASRLSDATNMLLKIIEDAKKGAKSKSSSLLLQKKIYTLIGILYEEQREQNSSNSNSRKDHFKRRNTLTSLLREDDNLVTAAANFRAIDAPWKGAEAYHLYLLAQRQLFEGYMDAAMKSALHLRDYEEFIDIEDIYGLIALAACANKSFSICSKAFIKLESLEHIGDERREEYEQLAVSIFSNFPPKESKNVPKAECSYCETMIADYCTTCVSCDTKFAICMASGRPIMDSSQQWTCARCQHHAIRRELASFTNCPLCHFPIAVK